MMFGDIVDFEDLIPKIPTIQIEKRNLFIFQGQDVIGPLTKSEIIKKIKMGQLSFFDFIFIEEIQSWISIKESLLFTSLIPPQPNFIPDVFDHSKLSSSVDRTIHHDFEKIKGENNDVNLIDDFGQNDLIAKSKKTVQIDQEISIQNDPCWMLEKGERSLGPYCYLEIVKMLQKNIITQNNKLKHIHDFEWKIISDIKEFSNEFMRKISTDKAKDASKLFVQRKFKRTPFLGPASIIYEGKLFRGTCTSISEGGCFIEMRPNEFHLHKDISIKIMPGTVPLSLEAIGKIVSINERSPRGIGIKFTNLSGLESEEVRKFVEKYGCS